MIDIKKLVQEIAEFGYEYKLFSEEDDHKLILSRIESNINQLDFLQDLDSYIYEKIYDNNKYIRKNKKLYKLLGEVNDLRKELDN